MTPIAAVRGNLRNALRRDPGIVSEVALVLLTEVPPEMLALALSEESQPRIAESVRFWRSLGVRRAPARAIAFAEAHYRRHLASVYGDDFVKYGVIRLRGYDDGSVEIIPIHALPRH